MEQKPTFWSWRNVDGLQNGIQIPDGFQVSIRNEELMVSMLDLGFWAAPTDIRGINLFF